ncbi:MAG TPA: hypothetical protein VN704_08120 [Verrucomicrobiae bacterium]|nr:hypothetical protein [Verrucomicrobiae bacterium]
MKWPLYNQSLVRRYKILLGFDVINNWDTDLKDLNKDKVDEPFHYPNTFLDPVNLRYYFFIVFINKQLEPLINMF